MRIPLVDLKAQYDSLKNEIDDAIRGVIENSQFILGSEVQALESEIATYCRTKYAVGVASGTDALLLSLLACGIKSGDEVITTPFTFIATTEAIAKCGAIPVFADIQPMTCNIEPTNIESKITQRTKAILPVHLYGQPADMTPILEIASKYKLMIIEDCAQALGAEYKGRKAGSLGEAGCLSFFPSKVLGAYGDGGMVVTDNPEIAERVTMLRNHGSKQKYYYPVSGFNSRLDELQAAILRVKLRHLNNWIQLRRQKAALYSRSLGQIDGVQPPGATPDSHHVFNYYTIRLDNRKIGRDKLLKYLGTQGIATTIYYPLSLHLQQVYKSLGYKAGDFPESEKAQEEVLSLPIYPELSAQDIEGITRLIKAFCEQRAEVSP
jgi:dTDP-4-amino-4,6-dideoxygalactose transaminase